MSTPNKKIRLSNALVSPSSTGTVSISRTSDSNFNYFSHTSRSSINTVSAVSAGTKNPVTYKATEFTDTIHRDFMMDKLCTQIINTSEFKRLNNLLQLGVASKVFHCANHTRYQHSLGVAHLAEKLAKTIKNNQPTLGITDEDVLCVKIAGLCHDIGHGPFSHLFDKVVTDEKIREEWRHETRSVLMLRHLIESNQINISDFKLKEEDLVFIGEMIDGTPEEMRKGRLREKSFLYDIVSNSVSGFDVDRVDYLLRDSHMTSAPYSITDLYKFIERARVLPAQPIAPRRPHNCSESESQSLSQGCSQASNAEIFHSSRPQGKRGLSEDASPPLMICFPRELVPVACGFYHQRFTMHKTVYQNQKVKQFEHMLLDVLKMADEHLTFPGSVTEARPSGLYRPSEAVQDMKAFKTLDDRIIYLIERSQDVALQPARELLGRIDREDLYGCAGYIDFVKGDFVYKMTEDRILNEIIEESKLICGVQGNDNIDDSDDDDDNRILDMDILQLPPEEYSRVTDDDMENFREQSSDLVLDIIVEKLELHHGQKEYNPVRSLRFFSEAGDEPFGVEANAREYDSCLPSKLCERLLQVYCRDCSQLPLAKKAFENWCVRRNLAKPQFSQG